MNQIRTLISDASLYDQLAEEATELAHACLKMARKLRNENPTPMTMADIDSYVIEEYTDVVLCAMILKLYPNNEMISFKQKRWNSRLKASQE